MAKKEFKTRKSALDFIVNATVSELSDAALIGFATREAFYCDKRMTRKADLLKKAEEKAKAKINGKKAPAKKTVTAESTKNTIDEIINSPAVEETKKEPKKELVPALKKSAKGKKSDQLMTV